MFLSKSSLFQLNQIFKFNFAVAKNIPRRLLDRMPPRQKLFTVKQKNIQYNPFQAIQLVKLHTFCTFKQSVQVCVQLGVNPKNGQQIVRGTVFMPSGIGKQIKVAVLCSNDEYKQLKQKGSKVDMLVDEAQIKKLQKGIVNFDKLFTTSDNIGKIKHLGRFLGPKGLMPNAKIGTLVKQTELFRSINEAKAGSVSFRVDAGANIHALIGKIDFTQQQLMLNFRELMKALVDKKPANIKGKYFLNAFIKSTMGPRWKLNLNDIDPRANKNIWELLDKQQPKKVKQQSAQNQHA